MGIAEELWKQAPIAGAIILVVKMMMNAQGKMHKENREMLQRQMDECMQARKDTRDAIIDNTEATTRIETTLRDLINQTRR